MCVLEFVYVYVWKAAILCLQRTINIQAWEKLWSDVFTAACVPLVLYIRTPNSQILNRTRSRLSNPGSACLAFRDEEGPDPSNKVCQECRNTLPMRSYWCANLLFLFTIVNYIIPLPRSGNSILRCLAFCLTNGKPYCLSWALWTHIYKWPES